MADTDAYFGNPHTTAQGLKAKLSAGRESEGRLEALVRGLMGEAPDTYGSVLDPAHAENRSLAQGAFGVGTALQVAPLVGPALRGVKGALSLLGSGPAAGGRAAQRGVIKAPGGNWDKESVERALADVSGYQEGFKVESPIGSWVDKNLRNYVTRDMATERDPVRKLLLEHPEYAPQDMRGEVQMAERPSSALQAARAKAGFPKLGAADVARPWNSGHYPAADAPGDIAAHKWDLMADRAAMPQTVDKFLHSRYDLEGMRAPDSRSLFQPRYSGTDKPESWTAPSGEIMDTAHHWMLRADPNTPIHSASAQHLTRLGMGHVLDELENATAAHGIDPAVDDAATISFKNAGLALDPAKLSRMSVADAYAHVGKIDQWREAQAALADAARANSRAAVPLKDYGGDKGLKWVELKLPEPQHVPGVVQLEDGTWGLKDNTGHVSGGFNNKAAAEIAQRHFAQGDPRYKPGPTPEDTKDLEDALRYEGEQMRHCVGGYCDDVAGGGTRILSLRDATGKPHATVELSEQALPVSGEAFARLPPALKAQYREHVMQWRRRNPEVEELTDEHTAQALREAGIEAGPPDINQIKGPSNGPVKPEYQQHVLDLLNGGVPGLDKGWGAVNDLGLQGLLSKDGKYLSHEEWLRHQNSEPPGGIDVGDGNNYAHGGLVYPTQHGPYGFNRAGRNKAFRKTGYAEGGAVDTPSSSIDDAAHQAATSPNNDRAEPTEAQKAAGNYKKGPVYLHGMRLSIENPQGSTRSGVDADGEPWESTLNHHYGYLRGTSGRDKDHLDVFLGPEAHNADAPIHVVDQYKPHTGQFDEHKVMLGFPDDQDAIDAYHSNYGQGWRGFGQVTAMDLPTFKRWAFADGRRVKPAAEHSVAAVSDVAAKLEKLKAEQ